MHGSELVIPTWFWVVFLFAIGCCVGSFLNVVIYRIPREKSLVKPPSSCPSCGRHIQFYDNIPLISWLLLGGKCRYCKARISPRYFVIELITGLVFVGIFVLYFNSGLRHGIPGFLSGGWILYVISVVMLSALIACSAIDLELWIIPLSICWVATLAGLIGGTIAPYIIHPATIRHYFLLPTTFDFVFISPTKIAALSAGGLIGLLISLFLLFTGILKRSYEISENENSSENQQNKKDLNTHPVETDFPQTEGQFNDRIEMAREIIFLLPIIICAIAASWFLDRYSGLNQWWSQFLQIPGIEGFIGSLTGYFFGCAIVWAIRIFGTLAFGKEAMGLGDVHLMGAAGTVIGPLFIIVAFFIAPFFGLMWAAIQMLSKKTRQIPYGPFLSLGILIVMIFHDKIIDYLKIVYGR